MNNPMPWSAGRYQAVAERIASIAEQVVDAAGHQQALAGATVVDLACGTGSAALSAAARGARVTGVDITAELIAIARARDGADAVDWQTGDASDTGLPAASFDVVVSNMGIIFVDPLRQLAEITRLLKPSGTLAFSAWVRDDTNPFFDPVVAVLGAPAQASFGPEQWGDEAVVRERLAPHFEAVELNRGRHRWTFESMGTALHFLRAESPIHVGIFERADTTQQQQLTAAFESALRPHLDATGAVAFDASYAVITAALRP